MKIPQEVRDLIESAKPAHLVTVNPDGSPQVTIVWIGLDGDEIVAAHLPKNQKVKNILRDPRVAISIEAGTRSSMELTEYAVIYGEARIQQGGAANLLQKLAQVYIRPGVKFPPMDNPLRDTSPEFASTESMASAHGQGGRSDSERRRTTRWSRPASLASPLALKLLDSKL